MARCQSPSDMALMMRTIWSSRVSTLATPVPRAVVPDSGSDPPCGLSPSPYVTDRLELVADESLIATKEAERVRWVYRARVGSVASDYLYLGGAHARLEGG